MEYDVSSSIAKSKIAITVEAALVTEVDRLVKSDLFPNRSAAFEAAARLVIRAAREAQYRFELTHLGGEEDPWPAY